MLQIRPGTIIFPDVSLMFTVHYKDNSHKLYLKFHLKLFVHTDNNFDSKTYFMSIYSAKGKRICRVYEKTVCIYKAWETSVGHPYLLQQKL